MTHNPLWQGRVDSGESGDTRRLHQIVQFDTGYGPGDAVLMGFACDAGVRRNQGRPGAQAGPAALRRMLASLPAHALPALWDAGDVACEGDALEAAQEAQGQRLAQVLDSGARVVVLGGGHEIAWADYLGLRAHLYGMPPASDDEAPTSSSGQADTPPGTGNRLLVLNLDAHLDLRSSRPASSGTPFNQILEDSRLRGLPVQYACLGVARTGNTAGLLQHAQDLGVFWLEDTTMQERFLDQRLRDLDQLLAQADHVYLTIDLDVLPATVMPGVSAPNPYGVPLTVIEACVARVRASGKLRLADLAEFNPVFDIAGHGARVAARLVWQLLQPM